MSDNVHKSPPRPNRNRGTTLLARRRVGDRQYASASDAPGARDERFDELDRLIEAENRREREQGDTDAGDEAGE